MFCYEEVLNINAGGKLFTDALYYAVLDSGCTDTVCGEEWLSSFMQSLSPEARKTVKEYPSEKLFRFGDGDIYKSIKKVVLPVNIGGLDERLGTEVVECFIPLLLSRKSMEKGDISIHYGKNTGTIRGKALKLQYTSTGYHCISLQKKAIIKG